MSYKPQLANSGQHASARAPSVDGGATVDAVRLSATMQALGLTVAPLAAVLGNSRRTVQRWLAGSVPVPAGVWRDLAAYAERMADCAAVEASPARAEPLGGTVYPEKR